MINQPANTQLAELNIGRLVAPTGDPAVVEFMNALDKINGMGKRMQGFVWMMEGSGEPGTGNTENNLGDYVQMVTNLTVWQDVGSLEKFVFNTAHSQFFQRRHEWFEVKLELDFVMWWVPEGHQPTLAESLARLGYLRENGDSDHAFGWAYVIK